MLTCSLEIYRPGAGDYSMSLLLTPSVEVFKARETKEGSGL
jgi:hypothetical protein